MKKKLILFFLLIVFAMFVRSILSSSLETNASEVLQAPSVLHFFGTDALGRDLLLRVLEGTAVTLIVGLVASLVSALLGVTVGFVSGWVGGWVDVVLQRICEVMTTLPSFVLVALLVFIASSLMPEAQGDSLLTILILGISMGLSLWSQMARVTRAMVLREKVLPYIEAANATGVPLYRMFVGHLLPNLLPTLAVTLGNQIPQFLMFEGFLSFVGMGLRPPTTSWGILLREGWRVLATYPHLLFLPAVVIVIVIFAIQQVLAPDPISD